MDTLNTLDLDTETMHGSIPDSGRAYLRKRVKLSDTDYDVISECLEVAENKMAEMLQIKHQLFPEAMLCDSLRKWIEQAADIRERIEAR